ncbi:unnamed protein product [Anisakis simplex]|uniref:DUF3591 domain-containing protein n=1 Tax=Anisakis simplex TaxID=6269 RepID=A0A0M3JP35_ANISI|nr:unnamed protein product [Anisakis simplex]
MALCFRSVSNISSGSLIQHSIPAQNIHRTFFPTHLNPFKLRHYHRLPLPKRILRTIGTKYVPIKTLTKLIKEKEEVSDIMTAFIENVCTAKVVRVIHSLQQMFT